MRWPWSSPLWNQEQSVTGLQQAECAAHWRGFDGPRARNGAAVSDAQVVREQQQGPARTRRALAYLNARDWRGLDRNLIET
jgi:hypothetical protein